MAAAVGPAPVGDRQAQAAGAPVLADALREFRAAFAGIAVMTAMINVLALTGSFFMLEVYDRVVPGRSVPTLVGLSALALLLYLFNAVLEVLRGRILVRLGGALDSRISPRVYRTVVELAVRSSGSTIQPIRDLDQVKGFLSTPGPAALFDLPWMPLYLGICFVFHPLIGWTASAGGLALIALTLLTEKATRAPTQMATAQGSARQALAEASRRNAEVLTAMNMTAGLEAAWQDVNARHMASNRRAADIAGGLATASRCLRMVLQSAVLGVGAYLVIKQQATAGIMIAGSIIAARSLAPVELAIANWRGFVAARQSWRRLEALLGRTSAGDRPATALPPPSRSLAVEGVSVATPDRARVVVQDVSFQLSAGDGLAIIGPSASGKSSLVRALVGAWLPVRGKVRVDGAAIDQWPAGSLGSAVGYLPQDIELFAGSVAQNIGRFSPDADSPAVIAAAKAAGIHDLILRLPQGYDTEIGEFGSLLSTGQRQRLALARALYGDPFLLVLDEPNSNLDAEGEDTLTQAMIDHRQRGGILVVVAHRPSTLAAVDLVLAMSAGRMQAYGPKEEVLAKVLRKAAGLRVVDGTGIG